MADSCALIIDPNPAVQAIASLVLSQNGFQVHSLSNGKTAQETIKKLQPNLVLCAKEAPGFDGLELLKKIKGKKSKRSAKIILLVSAENLESVTSIAKDIGIDEILTKPFQSEQLQTTLNRIFSKLRPQEDAQETILLVLKEPFLQRVIERFLTKHALPSTSYDPSKMNLIDEISSPYAATLTDVDHHCDVSWYQAEKMGKLFLIRNPEGDRSLPLPPGDPSTVVLERPLSYAKLVAALQQVMPEFQALEDLPPFQLDPAEQALLAARIAASVFEKLLAQESLRDANWDEAGSLAQGEVVRVCQDLEKLLRAGK